MLNWQNFEPQWMSCYSEWSEIIIADVFETGQLSMGQEVTALDCGLEAACYEMLFKIKPKIETKIQKQSPKKP